MVLSSQARDVSSARMSASIPGRCCSSKGVRCSAAPQAAVEASSSFKASTFLRPHLLELAPYTPIEPFEVRQTCTSASQPGVNIERRIIAVKGRHRSE
jgi:hypothetical protein